MDSFIAALIKERTAPLIAGIAGVMILIASSCLAFTQPTQLPFMANGFLTPILALEFSHDLTQAKQMLGHEIPLIHALRDSLWWDMGLILGYGVFLIALVFTFVPGGVLRYIALTFAVVAPIADILENLQLWTLLDFLASATALRDESPIDFMYLRLAVVVKFAAIAIVHIRLLRFVVQSGLYGRVASAFLLGSIFATGAGFYSMPYALDIALMLISIAWCLLWLMALERLRA